MPRDLLLAKPKSWDTFEDIVCDLFIELNRAHNFQRYGRQGLSQDGVDIVGVVKDEVIGIQCKHFIGDGSLTTTQIDDEITKAEKFLPELNKLIFATSSPRATNLVSHCLEVSQRRKQAQGFTVEILFWEDILQSMENFPRLIYKHFTRFFSTAEINNADDELKTWTHIPTCYWPTSSQQLETNAIQSIKEATKVDAYDFRLALTSFGDKSLEGNVNLTVDLDRHDSSKSPCEIFLEHAEVLREIRGFLKTPFYSNKVSIYLCTRLSSAFLAGWMFRRVAGFDARFIVNGKIYPTTGLPYVRNNLIFHPPNLMDPSSNEIVMIASLSRDISKEVNDSLSKLDIKPKWVVHYQLPIGTLNAAEVLSVSVSLSSRIRELCSAWQARIIHLFFAGPSAIAAQIGFNLNAISPICMYYKKHDDGQFVLAGIIKNDV